MRKIANWLPLIVIVVFGFILRAVYLEDYPPGVSWDEISHGFNSYSILKTGTDEWGVSFPLSNFRAYGDYPLALNLYLTMPFIAIWGLSVFSIRFPQALLGAGTIIASFFLAWGVTKSKKVSLLTAFLVAIEPWSWFLSRFVAQSNLSVFFLTSSFAAFFNREKSKYLMPLSILFLGLTLYSYHTTRIVTPVILFIALFVYRKDLGKILGKNELIKWVSITIFLVFFVPLPFILTNPESRARSKEVFLIDQGVVNRIIEKRQASNYPEFVKRVLYNRPVYFVTQAFKNHIGYYSPEFLFFKGGTHYQFSLQGKGLMYPVSTIFFYFGLFLAVKKAGSDKNFFFLILWFLAAPLSGSITKEAFAVMRSTPMIPLAQLFSAMGFWAVVEYLKKVKGLKVSAIVVPLYIGLLLLSLENAFMEYVGNYASSYSQDRQYGYKEVVAYLKENYDKHDKIVFSKKYGEPHEFVLFFWPWDPGSYRNDPNLVRFFQSDWYWVDRFDKFYFVNDWDIPEKGEKFILESKAGVNCEKGRCLLVTSPGNAPSGWEKVYSFDFLDGETAFEIYEN